MTEDRSRLQSPPPVSPPFGKADLSNCEREQIQYAGAIQPRGALLEVREPDLIIVRASANAGAFLGIAGAVGGQPLARLEGDLVEAVGACLSEPLDTIPRAVRCRVGNAGARFVCLLHRPAPGHLLLELEPAGPPLQVATRIAPALDRIRMCASLRETCDEAARLFKDVAGYDRAMVYRFDEAGHGEVYAECKNPELEPFLGLHYPASDIPQIARRLYERNRVRILADVEDVPVPLEPPAGADGSGLDMSLCFLRAMSPLHIQYLKNMGVRATLVASLMIGGRLWGLVACHHYSPRYVHYGVRATCELLAESVAMRIAALEAYALSQAQLSVHRLEQRLAETIAAHGDWRTALFDGSETLLRPLGAGGAALLLEDQTLSTGEVPGTGELRRIGEWLDERPRGPVFATASLAQDAPELGVSDAVASGLVATPISRSPGDYLIWFRPARVQTVTWAGNPFQPFEVGDDPSELSPRRSFAQWHQLVEGTSAPWTAADLAAARLIGETVSDVMLQFQSVSVLIAEDQLERVRRQVQLAAQPVVLADAAGGVLQTNQAFERLLPADYPRLKRIVDLLPLFRNAARSRAAFDELVAQRRSCRFEVTLQGRHGEAMPLLVRADPVLAPPNRTLGFVVMLTDLSERRGAEAARRRFQDGLVNGPWPERRLGSAADVTYRNLLSSVVGNAQLAALEITDGMDAGRMPRMLEGVRASVTRTAELLEHLVLHAGPDAPAAPPGGAAGSTAGGAEEDAPGHD